MPPMRMFSQEVPETAREGMGPIRRTVLKAGPELSVEGVSTLYECFLRGASISPNGPCIGYRPIDSKGEAGDFVWFTYNQTLERIRNFGSGLANLNVCMPNEDGLSCLGFYAKNRMEWVIGEQACYRQSYIPVPLYDTLGADAVQYVIDQTSCPAVVCSSAELDVVFTVASNSGSTLKCIILMDNEIPSGANERAAAVGAKLHTMAQVEELGKKNPVPSRPPSSKDIAFFCYTSGTTGDPKGALTSHEGMMACLAGIRAMNVVTTAEDVHLSYLPLPHVFERSMQTSVFYAGASIGFYQGDPLKIMDDLVALRPTLFPSVPRLLNRIYDKIVAGVEEAGGIKAWLFNKALAAKVDGLVHGHLKHALWDKLVFGPLKAKLGFDRVRIMLTGSAPLAPHVMNFLRAAFGVPVHEGYGQTESSGVISFTFEDDLSLGHVGAPVPCCEIRLVDVPEMGYLSSDRVHGAEASSGSKGIKCLGRGEICFRGPNVFQGYYKMEDKTKETVDEEGWCHTGDIGLWLENGLLKIIDRKKNIFKLSQGEYVAAEKIENCISASPFIMQSFVYGDSLQSQLVAIVVVDPEYIEPWAKKHNVSGATLAEICANPSTKKAVLDDIQKQSKSDQLKGFETVKNIHVEFEMFSVDNNLLTPTFKLKRPQARDHYRPIIDKLYEELNSTSKL